MRQFPEKSDLVAIYYNQRARQEVEETISAAAVYSDGSEHCGGRYFSQSIFTIMLHALTYSYHPESPVVMPRRTSQLHQEKSPDVTFHRFFERLLCGLYT